MPDRQESMIEPLDAAVDHERVFDPFFTTKDVGHGTGLGLDTARRIVEERHGGSLTLDSGEQGTTFGVWLALKPPYS